MRAYGVTTSELSGTLIDSSCVPRGGKASAAYHLSLCVPDVEGAVTYSDEVTDEAYEISLCCDLCNGTTAEECEAVCGAAGDEGADVSLPSRRSVDCGGQRELADDGSDSAGASFTQFLYASADVCGTSYECVAEVT